MQEPKRGKLILKKNKVGGLTLTNFKTYYKATVVKALAVRNKIKSPEINSYIYGYWFPAKLLKQFSGGKDNLF